MIRAVCGFYFSEDRQRLALIHKERPAWQRGKLNGIGGKVEEGEFCAEAMRREFREETGADIAVWDPFCVLRDEANGYEVTYYRAFGSELGTLRTTTDEKVEVFPVSTSGSLPLLHNLSWLIPMALDPNVSRVQAFWQDT